LSRDRRQRENRRRSRRASEAESPPADLRFGLPASVSGDVAEFDAALVRGAQGVPAPLEDEREDEPSGQGRPIPAEGNDAVAPEDDELHEEIAGGEDGGNGGGRGGGEAFGGDGEGGRRPPAPSERGGRRSLPSRALAFGKASWAELQRVQWPDRREVWQATAVVLGFVAVAGVYLGAADWVAEHIIKAIL
jgi:preprotein translocase subunit SecE